MHGLIDLMGNRQHDLAGNLVARLVVQPAAQTGYFSVRLPPSGDVGDRRVETVGVVLCVDIRPV